MKAALQFIGSLSQSLNMLFRGASKLSLGSFQDDTRAISSFVQSPRCFSSDWRKKQWPEKTVEQMSKRKGDLRDNRLKQGDRPSRVKREQELQRMGEELRKSRKGHNLPSKRSHPRSSSEEMTESNISDRYRDEAEQRILEKGQSPHYHYWSPCSRKCYQDAEEMKPNSEKPLK